MLFLRDPGVNDPLYYWSFRTNKPHRGSFIVKNRTLFLQAALCTSILIAGCDSSNYVDDSSDFQSETAFRTEQQIAYTQRISDAVISALTVDLAAKNLPRPALWADEELFVSVVTPATFKPGNGPFDELYAGDNGFLDGVPLISDSKPGDQDFNGGRWHLNVLKSDVDPDKYSAADSVEDLDLNDFMSTTDYFECPVRPRRGRGN